MRSQRTEIAAQFAFRLPQAPQDYSLRRNVVQWMVARRRAARQKL